jgi:hypothetical protein
MTLFAATIVGGGCISPTESCAKTKSILGTWTYSGLQENPVRATVNGSLVISAQTCSDFVGTLDVLEVSSTGESRRIAGPVSGVLIDSSSARFSAMFAGNERQHLARFTTDSVKGSWIQLQGSSAAAGNFAGRQASR